MKDPSSNLTEKPDVSIITASFNPGSNLEQCLHSVEAQTFMNYEHILIDGGSNDGTVDKLQAQNNPRLRWISKTDTGIADAMNRGIKMARGDWLIFLHTDDSFKSNEALQLAQAYLDNTIKIACFDVEIRTEQRPSSIWITKYSRTWRKMPGSHQGMFFHRDIFEQFGDYDTSFKIAMDYNFVYKIYQAQLPYRVIHEVATVASGDGLSGREDWKSLHERFLEERRVHFTHAKGILSRLRYMAYWILYPAYRKLLL
jgi:glycosyltransferase involved in cell wall biosynthesis